ncbi:hypothetical protein OH77DRAFT_1410398 [Trametes cingulata]|nr:hypothetical protein OH77DRAFT_1410398 [Trametes cingulata]
MFAQYSPLFTSGLLSESNTPSSSRRPSLEFRDRNEKAPRGSLPVDANLDSFYEASSSAAEDDAVFLTFMPRRRRDAGNSFLSLDLAESHSLRSMSLRRKDTVTTRATTHFGRSVPTSPNLRPMASPPPMPLSFSHFGPAPQPRRTLVRHSSREGLPGAKPVPSSQLPATPPVPRRPRPSDLTLTLSACLSTGSSNESHSLHRTTHSEPSIVSPISPLMSPMEHSYLAFSPPSSPPATSSLHSPFDEAQRSPPTSAPPVVSLRARPSVRSSVSFRTRQVNRSAALAALEGRSPANSHSRQRSRPKNFMSMSDDEDDGESDQTENHVPPAPAPSAPLQQSLLDVLQEEEDVVVPTQGASAKRASASTPASRKSRSRRGTIESLLSPLTNFIDFRDDDGSTRSWRSFVEIS